MSLENRNAYLAIQMKEIDEFKDYLNRVLGHFFQKDCNEDYESTLQAWVKHGAAQYSKHFFQHLDKIKEVCKNKCNNDCHCLIRCILSYKEIHEILED